jgi:hypothetical protein
VIALFHKIQQFTTVDAYISEFEGTMREVRKDNPYLPENYFIRSFVSRLKDYVQNLTQVQRPDNLHEAYWLARRFEKSYPFKKSTQGYSPFPTKNKSGYKHSSGTIYSKNIIYKPVKAGVTSTDTKGENKCFRCNEKWFPGINSNAK